MSDMTVGKALKWLFIAQILGILVFIPLVGAILGIVAIVLNLVALYGASKLEEGYKTAFTLSIVGLVVSVVEAFAGNGVLGTVVGIISTLISLAILYMVIKTTNDLLNNGGDHDLVVKGNLVWKINLICAIANVVLSVLMAIVPVLTLVLAVIVAIVGIVGGIIYLIYLYKSSAVL